MGEGTYDEAGYDEAGYDEAGYDEAGYNAVSFARSPCAGWAAGPEGRLAKLTDQAGPSAAPLATNIDVSEITQHAEEKGLIEPAGRRPLVRARRAT